MRPKISVIVPVYKAEKYLHRCVDSILSQTFTNFELILVDDGSPDNSGVICDEYAQKDNRVRVFHKENGGVSSARNLGLDNAQGSWIAFIDSDDWIDHTAYQNLIESNDADLIIGNIRIWPTGTTRNLFNINTKISNELLNDFLLHNINHISISGPWGKLYKRNIIENNKLRFNISLCLGEDSLFVKNYLLYTHSICYIDNSYYNYLYINDDFYFKYSKSFSPVLGYYFEMKSVYKKLEETRGIKIPREELVGFIYDIAKICIRQHYLKDKYEILKFFKDTTVIEELKKRNSINIKIELFLAKIARWNLLALYVKIVSYIKLN